MLKLLVGLAGIFGAGAYSSGARDCQSVGHGNFQTSVPSDLTMNLLDSTGSAVTSWTAGQSYTVQLQASTTKFKGWSWAPLKGTPISFPVGSSSMAGSFAAGDSYSHSNTGCVGSITQTSGGTSRSLATAVWTPPAAGTGTVSLWAMVVISKNGNNYNVVHSVTEGGGAVVSLSATATQTRSGSKGASSSATSTSQASPTTSYTATASVKNSPAAAYVAVPSAAPQQVTVQTSATTYSMVGVAIGGAMAGAVLLAVVGPVVHHLLKGRSHPISTMTKFNLPPQQIVTSNPLESSPAYSFHAT